MDALILSCGTGGGHDAAARAVECVLQQHGVHTLRRNPYTLCSEKTAETINKAYVGTVKRCPAAFGLAYRAANGYRKLPWRSPVYHFNRKMARRLQAFLMENPFDIIITTHLFPAEIVTQMRNHGMTPPKTVFVATDYACIPFTEETSCDAYVIPSEKLTEDFLRRGIPREKLYPLGIPVHPDFTAELSQAAARERLGLAQEGRYILLCGGSMGAGGIKTVLKDLFSREEANTKLIVICGSNEKLYSALEQKYGARLTLLQHTDKMPLYMKACDLYLTKPGGLSSSEAAAMGVPLVHLPPIPGCESINAAFFAENGMSILYTKEAGAEAVWQLLKDRAAQQRMVQTQKTVLSGNGAEGIYALACQLTGARGTE